MLEPEVTMRIVRLTISFVLALVSIALTAQTSKSVTVTGTLIG